MRPTVDHYDKNKAVATHYIYLPFVVPTPILTVDLNTVTTVIIVVIILTYFILTG